MRWPCILLTHRTAINGARATAAPKSILKEINPATAAHLITDIPNAQNARVHRVAPTNLGLGLLSPEGVDPYMEDLATWWWLHWMMLAPGSQLPVWWILLNELSATEFNDELAELVVAGSIDSAITPPPEVIPAFEARPGFEIPGYIHACEIVPNQDLVAGEYSTFWSKLRCRVFAGEEPTGIERLAAVVDFASGAGNAMDYTRFSSINPDLTVHILKEPRSDWIAIRGRTLRAIDGIGMSHATIHDLKGPITEASGSLLLGER